MLRKLLLNITSILALVSAITFAYATKLVQPVKFDSFFSTCQYTFAFSQAVHYRGFALANPYRWVMDFTDVPFQENSRFVTRNTCPVKGIRTSKFNGNWRVVFDLRSNVRPEIHKSAIDNNLIVEFPKPGKRRTTGRSAVQVTTKKQTSRRISKPKVTAQVTAAPASQQYSAVAPEGNYKYSPQKLRKIVIVIDPGHGGKDPGAIGKSGVHEKYIVLQISHDLYKDINDTYGFKAYLTRKTDVFLRLRQRLAVARRYRPNLFVAIHADAFLNDKASGASVFALSQRGATSEAARWLAVRENASELVGGVELSDKSHMLRSVLIDLSQTATIGSSMQIGQTILHSLGRKAKLHHKRVEQAAFVVLKSPDIPSLLIETGFLSNRREEYLLRKSSYRKKIAAAIAYGIVTYFKRNPPSGTLIWARYKGKAQSYVVRRGDSLSKIAQRYRISTKSLKSHNNLTSSSLNVGQVLRIPI